MKKFVGFLMAGAIVALTACDKKENSYNFAQVLYPNARAYLYADQTTDTLKFATTYDWSIDFSASWLRAAEGEATSGEVPDGFYMVENVDIVFDVNNTGRERTAVAYLHANGSDLGGYYTQFPYLNVSRPAFPYKTVVEDSALQVRDSLVFQTYASEWTLAFKGEAPTWVRLADGAHTTGNAGKYVVYYELEPNHSTEARTAVLQLNSLGVVAEIQVEQAGKPREENEETN